MRKKTHAPAAEGVESPGRMRVLKGVALISSLSLPLIATSSLARDGRAAEGERNKTHARIRIAEDAQEAATVDFNIPQLSVADALAEWSKQTGLQVLRRDMDGATELTTGSVTGKFSPAAALQKMLAGTGLTYEFVNEWTVRIAPLRTSAQTISYSPQQIGAVTLAQNTGNTAEGQSPNSQTPDPDQRRGDQYSRLEEVIVTAQKRSENLQNVPLSVGTISGEALKTYGETHLTDYAASIPGLAVESAYGVPGSVTVSIRGISTADADNTPTVATYIDDVPVSASGGNGFGNLIGTDLFTYDVDHVEVLKGPQGTLYGASSLGGLLKYVTRTPDLNRSSFHIGQSTVAIEHSPQLGWGMNGAASVPIVPGQLALSISAAHVFTPGYIDNVAKNDEGFNHGVQDGARLALFWKPIDRLSVKLSALYDRSDYDGLGLILADPATQKPIYGYLSTAAEEPEGQSARTTLLAANLSYDFDAANLTSVTGYSQAAAVFEVDASPVFEPIFGVRVPFLNHYDFDKFTQEVRLSSTEINSFHWLLGGFYTRENSSRNLGALALTPTGQPDEGLSPLIESQFQNRFEEVAVFGNATYELTTVWNISAGARYSRNEQTYSGSATGALSGPPTYYPPASGHKVTYSVSTQYHFAPDAMAYARVATGYRPGGDNGETPGVQVPPTYGPDTTVNYEVGLKSELLARRLLANASVFYIDWENIQLEVIGPLESFYYSNAAQASSKGVEVSSSYVAAPGLQFGLNATFTDATLNSDTSAVGGAKGDRLPASARWAGAFNAEYTHALYGDYQGRVGLVWRYVGDRGVAFPAASNYQRLAAYDTVSVSAGVSNERWNLNLYVRNVANERTYLSWSGPLGPVILQPRTIGLNVGATF